jgi:hypothetical protein
VAREEFVIFFSEVFDAMFRLCADSEQNVQNAVQFLDNLVKAGGSWAAAGGQLAGSWVAAGRHVGQAKPRRVGTPWRGACSWVAAVT